MSRATRLREEMLVEGARALARLVTGGLGLQGRRGPAFLRTLGTGHRWMGRQRRRLAGLRALAGGEWEWAWVGGTASAPAADPHAGQASQQAFAF